MSPVTLTFTARTSRTQTLIFLLTTRRTIHVHAVRYIPLPIVMKASPLTIANSVPPKKKYWSQLSAWKDFGQIFSFIISLKSCQSAGNWVSYSWRRELWDLCSWADTMRTRCKELKKFKIPRRYSWWLKGRRPSIYWLVNRHEKAKPFTITSDVDANPRLNSSLYEHIQHVAVKGQVHYIKLLLWIEKWKTVGFAMKVRKAKLTPCSSSNVWGTHHYATHYHRINSLRLCLRIIGFNLTCILATYYIHYQWVVPELCPTAAKIRIEVTPESINQSNQATSGKPLVVVRNRGFDRGY